MCREAARAAFLVVALVAAAARAQPATGELEGVVLDRATEQPLGGVAVTMPDVGRSATTDEAGRFRFAGAPAGRHALVLAAPELVPVTVDEEVTPGALRQVRYLIAPERARPYESTVRAPRVERASVVETGLSRAEARRVAGTGDDPLKVVEDLPGVGRSAIGSGQLIVWGAAPADTRVLVDGVEIPALYHLGGWRSTVNGDLVGRVSLAPGGFGPAYGRALGGLVQVETAPLPSSGVHGYVAADVLDASALLSAAIGKRLTVAVAGRYSWLDRLAGAIVPASAAAFVPLPRYDDYQLAATLKLRARESLSLLFLASDDDLRRTLHPDDPTALRADAFDRSSYRLMLRYEADRDGAGIDVTPFFGYDSARTVDTFGMTPASLATVAVEGGVRAGYRRRLGRFVTLGVGLDLLDTHTHVTRVGSLTIPPREGDLYVFGQPPGADVAAADDRFHELDAAPWASLDVRLGPVVISPGLRVDALLVEGNHVVPPVGNAPVVGFSRLGWTVDPRLSLRWRAHARLTLTAAAGLYHQPPDPVDLGARFGNPTLGPSRALHVVAGAEVRILPLLAAELTGFYRQLDDLVSRSALPFPPVGAALVEEGAGRSYGGELLLRQAPWHGLSGWVSYTVARSEKRDHPDGDWRLSDYDQTHLFTVVADYALRGWDFGVRFRYASGFPRTPVVGAFWDAHDDRYDPIFGPHNAIRIPDFVQLDARVERTFVFRTVLLRLYLDVQNVTYQRNPEEIVYSEDYTQKSYITGLPTLAVLGARVQW